MDKNSKYHLYHIILEGTDKIKATKSPYVINSSGHNSNCNYSKFDYYTPKSMRKFDRQEKFLNGSLLANGLF